MGAFGILVASRPLAEPPLPRRVSTPNQTPVRRFRCKARPSLAWLVASALGTLAAGAAGRDEPLRLVRALSPESIELARAVTADARLGDLAVPAELDAQGNSYSWPLALLWAAENARNRSAKAASDAARGVAQQSRATAWMPSADLNAAATVERAASAGDSVRTTTSTLGATARLPLWNGAGLADVRAQDASVRGADWQARQVRIDVAREASAAYIAVAEALEQIRLIDSQRALLNEQLRINDQRLKGGAGTVLDVLETRTRLDQARAEQTTRQAQLGSQALALRRLTGRAVPAALAPLAAVQAGAEDAATPAGDSAGAIPIVVPEASAALQFARARNPALLLAQAQVDAAEATLEARRAGSHPTVDAVGSITRNRVGTIAPGVPRTTEASNVGSIGLQLNVPLYTGGLQDGRDKEAYALLGKAMAERDVALASVLTEMRDAYQLLEQARQQVTVQQQVVRTAAATVEAVRKAFVAGFRTNLDLLNTQQQVDVARQGLVSARVSVLNAQVTILALLDELDEDHVAPLAVTVPVPAR